MKRNYAKVVERDTFNRITAQRFYFFDDEDPSSRTVAVTRAKRDAGMTGGRAILHHPTRGVYDVPIVGIGGGFS